MKVLPVIVAGLVAGAVVGLFVALLRPRRRLSGEGYRPDVDVRVDTDVDVDAESRHPDVRADSRPALDARHD